MIKPALKHFAVRFGAGFFFRMQNGLWEAQAGGR